MIRPDRVADRRFWCVQPVLLASRCKLGERAWVVRGCLDSAFVRVLSPFSMASLGANVQFFVKMSGDFKLAMSVQKGNDVQTPSGFGVGRTNTPD